MLINALICLTSIYSQTPALVLPLGHTKEISQIQFSPNGKIILTRSEDETAKLWDERTGMLLFTFENIGRSVEFSPDGKYLAAEYKLGSIGIWETTTGQLVSELEVDPGNTIQTIHYSPDGKKILASHKNICKIWDIEKKEWVQTLTAHNDLIMCAAFSPDGKSILTGSGDKTAMIWDVISGKLLHTLKGHMEYIDQVGYCNNGNIAFTVSWDETIMLWNVSNGKLLHVLHGTVSAENKIFGLGDSTIVTVSTDSIKVWNMFTGKLSMLLLGHKEQILNTIYSPDKKIILSTSTDHSTKTWDVTTGKEIHSFLDEPFSMNTAAFSPNGQSFAAATGDNNVCVWNLKSNQLKYKLKGYIESVNNVNYNVHNKNIITASGDKTAKVWDSKSGKLLVTLEGHTKALNLAAYNPGGEFIITGSEDSTAKIWDAKTGKMIWNLRGTNSVEFAVFNSDASYIIIGGYGFAAPQIWNARTGIYLSELKADDAYSVLSAAFSPDSKKVVTVSPGNAKIWDVQTGKLLFNLNGFKDYINSATFSPDGKQILSCSSDKTIKIWEVSTGKLLHDYQAHDASVYAALFSPDGKTFASVSDDRKLKIWDAITATLIWEIKGHTKRIEFLRYSPDGKKILTTSLDGTAKIWNTKTGQLLLTHDLNGRTFQDIDFANDLLIASHKSEVFLCDMLNNKTRYSFIPIDRNDYILKIPTGYYMATTNAAKIFHYVTPGPGIITFDQLDIKYNRPDKLLEIINPNDTAIINSYKKAYFKRIKRLGIDTTFFNSGMSLPLAEFYNRDNVAFSQPDNMLELHIKAIDSTFFLDRFNIWVNEVPVYGQRGISLRNKDLNNFDSSITIKLSQGENRIETSISNVNGTESYRMPLIVNYIPAIKQKEKTFFIGIGIDKFVEHKYNLQYSAKDIRDLAKKLKEKYKDDVIIDTLFNENVTTSNVKALKQKLLQSSENDKVIIAYSGHGMLSKEYDYYLSTYSVNFENPVQDGLPYDELENLLDSIPARKKLLLIDACHSGEVDKEELEKIESFATTASIEDGTKGVKPLFTQGSKKLGMKNSFELMQQLFVNVGRSTGAIVISAAGGTQFALERGDLKNGVFTYAILEAMKDHPTIKISELKRIVGQRVEDLTKGLQKPTSRNETIAVDWDAW